jgi:hypothetical protein
MLFRASAAPSQGARDLSGNRWFQSPYEGRAKVAHKFEIYKDKAGEFRVRFKYNSEVMFSTEGYSSKASAQNAIDSIKKNGPGAEVEDNS